MIVAALLVGAGTSSTLGAQTTIFVDQSNLNCPGSGSQSDPFCLIQDGIDAASDGDTVLVRPGTYLENIDLLGMGINVRSSAGAELTIIDGQARAPVITCESGEPSGTVVQGFTIRNGRGKPHPPFNRDGGAGIFSWSASPTILNCTISGNVGPDGSGGGALFGGEGSYARIAYCRVVNNTAGYGAGILIKAGATGLVKQCLIADNTASEDGGGLTFDDDTTGRAVGCVIVDNHAVRRAGGLQLDNTQGTVVNCTISGNTAGSGGGVWAFDNQVSTITNTIIWENSPQEIRFDSGTLDVQHSDVRGGWPGTGNIQLDPQFIDAPNGDFRLACTSPCVDTGTNATGVTMPRFDQSGLDNRIIGTIDIGADELGVTWDFQGTGAPGSLAGFLARASSGHPPVMVGEVYLSLGDGSVGGGIPVPLSGGRRLGLEVDSLLSAWLFLGAFRQVTTLNGCTGTSTQPFTIPGAAPPGITFYYAGVTWDLTALRVTSVSETKSAVTQ